MAKTLFQLKWKKRQLARARQSWRFMRSQITHPTKPHTSKSDFLEALRGTGGIKARIAENLGVAYGTVLNLLRRPDWEDVRQFYYDEVEAGIDDAENTVRRAITQNEDLALASLNARWYLSKVRKEKFGEEVTVQGGKSPIKTVNMNIPIDTLKLPLEVKRQVLAALDAQQAEQQEAANGDEKAA